MTTLFLKFPTEAEAKTVLAVYVSQNEWLTGLPVGGWVTGSHTHALDIIGTIYKPTGVMLTDAEGIEYPETAPVDGFHINILGAIPEGAEAYAVIPENPVRMFA